MKTARSDATATSTRTPAKASLACRDGAILRSASQKSPPASAEAPRAGSGTQRVVARRPEQPRAASVRARASAWDESRTASADGTASATDPARSCSRRGSTATATARPTAPAIQAPRLKVKYTVAKSKGRVAAESARRERLRLGREAEREQRTHHREDAEARVPVRQRLREAVCGDRVVDASRSGNSLVRSP